MSDTYKGDSPSKKAVRTMFWLSVFDAVGRSAFETRKHVVLASREGGDIIALKAMGVSPSNIIACELDASAAAAASLAHPDVEVLNENIFTVCRRYRKECASIYFDFCSPLTLGHLNKISQVAAQAAIEGGIIGACFLAGRERKPALSAIGEERSRIQNMRSASEANLKAGGEREQMELEAAARALCRRFDFIPTPAELTATVSLLRAKGADRALQENDDEDWIESFAARHEAVSTHFAKLAWSDGWVIPIGGWYYASRTIESKGVPMFVWMGDVRRGRGNQLRRINTRGKPVLSRVTETESSLRDKLLDVGAPPMLARMMGFSDRTVAAWRAHRTMGTYERKNAS